MKENMEFKIGDKVTWESQAQLKHNTGNVIIKNKPENII